MKNAWDLALHAWLNILAGEGVAHGALLVQLAKDFGLDNKDLRAVNLGLLQMEDQGWIIRGERRPVPFQADLGTWDSNAPWTFDWKAAPWPLEVWALIDEGDADPRSKVARSDGFTALAALVHFDRTAGKVLRKQVDTSAMDAAAVDWAKLLQEGSKKRTRKGPDLDPGKSGKDGAK